MADTSNVIQSTISVTTSDYGVTVTDVVRGESGVTADPTTSIFDVVGDAIWWNSYEGKPSKLDSGFTPLTPVIGGGTGNQIG